MTTLSIIGVRRYRHANYPLLEPDVFGRVGGGFVRDDILTSFWQKRIFDPSLSKEQFIKLYQDLVCQVLL